MKFEKIKNILSRNKNWITVFTLIIVQVSLIVFVERYGDSLQAKPVKIKCNDPAFYYPKAFEYRAENLHNLVLRTAIIELIGLTIWLICIETFLTSNLNGFTFPEIESLEMAPIILALRWLSVMVIGFLSVILITFTLNYSLGTVAPNFLSACIPKPQKYVCNADYVSVTCTTLPHIWRRTGYSFPPTYATLQGYLAFAGVSFITHRFFWKGKNRYVNSFCQVSFIVLALLTGYNTVYDNEANWAEVLMGYLIGAGTAWMIIRVTFTWMKWGKEPGLPYYWNDVLQKIIVSQTGEIPVTPLPMWHREPERMEQQLPDQQNNENGSPQPGQETRQASSYQPIIFSSYNTPEYTENPPPYEDFISLNRT